MKISMMSSFLIASTLSIALVAVVSGQRGAGGGRGNQPPLPAQQAAPVDLTGYWVSVVTEDWRWRMTTPAKGDFISIPLSDEGRRVAFQWDRKTDGSCKAYGAGGLMHIPMRLNISWQGDDVLKVQTDAGQQTRLLQFG